MHSLPRSLVLALLLWCGSARAAMDPLCGTTITAATHPGLVVTLTQDLDCQGLTTPALIIGANGVTIDGGPLGFKIIAPDASRAISSTGFSNVTIKNTEVSGWCGGTGIWLDGGSGHLVDNVRIDSRSVGLDARNTTNLSLSRLTIEASATSAITLTNLSLTSPSLLTLKDLALTNNLVGLTLTNVNATALSPYTFGPYSGLTDSGAIRSLLANASGIVLSNSSHLRFEDLRIDASTTGIDAGTATNNTYLTFDGLDLSGFGFGSGLYLIGSHHTVVDVTANRRTFGLRAVNNTNLTLTRLRASGASNTGLSIETPTLPLTLTNLDLQGNVRAFNLTGLTATALAPYTLTAYDSGTGTGAIGSLAGSLTGLEIGNSKFVRVHDLTLDNPTYGIRADAITNDTLVFEDLDLSGQVKTGVGLFIGGRNITVEDVTITRRTIGLQANAVTALTLRDLTVTGSGTGAYLQSFTATHAPCVFDGLTLTHNSTGLHFISWTMPFTVRNTVGDSQSIDVTDSLIGIAVQTSSNLTFNDLILTNRTTGIDAYPSNTANTALTFNRVNASGLGIGTGIRAGGSGHTFHTITANDRDTGLALFAVPSLSVTTLQARNNRVQGLSLESTSTGTVPTLSGLDLRDNAIGLNINLWTLAMVLRNTPNDSQGLDFTGSDTAIQVGNSANITFRDLTLTNPTTGILAWHSSRATSNSNMRFENLDLSGTRGTGFGMQLGGANHVVDNVTADHRATGLFFASTDNLNLDRIFARNSSVGVQIQQVNTATWVGPTLGRMTLTHNNIALDLRTINRPFVVGPATPSATAGAIDVTGSLTGIYAASLVGTTFRNLVLANATHGFNGSDGSHTSLTFTNVDVSGAGLGTGLQLGRDVNARAGASHTLTDVRANHRVTGLSIHYSSALTLTRPIADQCDVGLLLDRPFDTAATNPTLTAIASRNSRVGLLLRWTNPWTVDLTGIGLDVSGSNVGLELGLSTNLIIDGNGAAGPAFALDNQGHGILAVTGNTNLTVRDINLSGDGLGRGIAISGSGHILEDLIAHDREIGFDLSTTTNPTLRRLQSSRAVTALNLSSTTVTAPLVATSLDLTHSSTGLNIATLTITGLGAFAITPATFVSLAGSPAAIRVTSAPAITYDVAGLTTTFGLTNPSTGTFNNTLSSASPLCGTTLTAATHPTLTLTLTADLDCTGVTGTALTVGADDFTIDGNGFRIIAPNANAVVTATNRQRLRIVDLDLSGTRTAGTGLIVDGGTGHIIENVIANRRATGADLRNTSNLTVSSLTANETLTTGIYLRSIALPLALTDLEAQTGSGIGLKLYGIQGAGGAPNGIDDLVIGPAQVTSVAGQSTSIQLENLVSHVTFDGLVGLDGRTAGLDVLAGNSSCTFSNLDVSMLRGAGIGLSLRGDLHTVDTVFAHRRSTGFDLMTGTGLTVNGPVVSGATTTALKVGGTGPLTLTAAELLGSTTALLLDGLVGTAPARHLIDPWSTTHPTGALKSTAGSLTGVSIASTSAYIDLTDLVLPNPSAGLTVAATTSNLRMTGLDVSGDRHINIGLQIRGANHLASDITADNRSTGLLANSASALSLTDVRARHNSARGLHLQSFAPALAAPTFSQWILTDNGIGLQFEQWSRPTTVDSTWQFDVSGSATGITISNTSTGLTVTGLTLANPANGLDAGDVTNSGLTLSNLNLDGPGRGNGLSIRGAGHLVSGGSANRRSTGLTTSNVSNLSVSGFTSRFSSSGLALLNTATGIAPTLSNLTLTDNDWGLYLDGWTLPWTLRQTDLVNLQRSSHGLRVIRSSDLTFENLVLDNPVNGFSGGDTNGNNARITLVGVNASGLGLGTGINLAYDGHTLTNVTANDRDTGFYFNRTGGLVANGLFAARTNAALTVPSSGTTSPNWRNLTFTRANIAISLQSFTTPMTLRNAGVNPTNLDTTGSLTAVYLNQVTGLTLEDMTLANVSRGVQVESGNVSSGLVFRRLNLDGPGIGYGMLGTGHNATLESITARDREYGIFAGNAPNLTVNGVIVERAAVTALHIDPTAGGLRPTLSNVALTQNNTGLVLRNITGPWVLDDQALVDVSGNQISLELNHAVTQTTLRNLTLDGMISGLSANSSSQNLANLTLEDLDVTGHCRGTGINLNGLDQRLERITAARRGTGIILGYGDRFTVTDSVIGANTTGLSLSSVSSIPNTTVVADVGNSTSQVKVNDTNGITVGKTLRVSLSPSEDRVVATVNTTTRVVTFAIPFSVIPPVGTLIRGLDYDPIRATLSSSDVCANGTGSASSAQGLVATTNYWRSSAGPRHATNPGCTLPGGCLGDLVTGTLVTLSPFVPTPTDLDNPYCNQAPLADAGPAQVFCEGDVVSLDAGLSLDPDIEPITFTWTQMAGTGVVLSDPDIAAPDFVAPGPYPGQPGPTQTLTFEVLVQDDQVRRRDEVTHTVARRNDEPIATTDTEDPVDEGATVTLSGLATDPEASPLSYAWTQTGGPAVTLIDATTPTPSFVAPDLGPGGGPLTATLTFELAASDTAPEGYCGGDAIGRSTVQVLVNNVNHAPFSDAGSPQVVTEAALVTLDGLASLDPDGDTLSYTWTQLGGTSVVLSDAGAGSPTFVAPLQGPGASETLTFGLVVADGFGGLSTVATVEVLVEDGCDIVGVDDTCDGVDDDCDGFTDNGYVSRTDCFLPGECATGNLASSCNSGIETPCRTGTPTVDDHVCDGLDEDCDGATDEDFATVYPPDVPMPCGSETCGGATGLYTCTDGVLSSTCDAFWETIPDTDCETLKVAYLVVVDPSGVPVGTARCFESASGVVTCDTEPGTAPGALPVLKVYLDFWCPG